jgi:CRISPR-associated protein Csx17
LTRSLVAALLRRLLDWENKHERGTPHERPPIAARLSDIESWLDGNVNETLLARWLSRLALFDWTFVPNSVGALARLHNSRDAVRPALTLYGLLRPLFDLRPVSDDGRKDGRDLLAPETGARTSAAARRIAALISSGDIERTVEVARSRYAMASAPIMRMDAPWAVTDSARLLAGLLFPVSDFDRAALVSRWLRPQRQASR